MDTGSENTDTSATRDKFSGRMNDPSAGAWVTGPCGDPAALRNRQKKFSSGGEISEPPRFLPVFSYIGMITI